MFVSSNFIVLFACYRTIMSDKKIIKRDLEKDQGDWQEVRIFFANSYRFILLLSQACD